VTLEEIVGMENGGTVSGELVFGSQIMPDETNGVNNAVSCYKEAV